MAKPNNQQKARAGRHFVAAELSRRGAGEIVFSGDKRSVEILASDIDHARTVSLRVKTKTIGDWQTDVRLGEQREADAGESRFWVLVDIGTDPRASASYFVVPERWVLNYIHEGFQNHLARHGGRRPRTPESMHCAIKPADVEEWRDRWDVLGIC